MTLAVIASLALLLLILAAVGLVNIESYPRLVPWDIRAGDLTRERGENDTTMTVRALSHACVLDRTGNKLAAETFDRVAVSETPHTVTIATRLGPPRGWRFRVGCWTTVGYGFAVDVQLDRPLGDRALIDTACYLERYAYRPACTRKGSPPYTGGLR